MERQGESLDERLLAQVQRAGTAHGVDPVEHAKLIAATVTGLLSARAQAGLFREVSANLVRTMPD